MSDERQPALVALRDRREAVIQVLSDSFANDLLDVETFEERLEAAHQATTVAALEPLIADLAPPPAGARSTALVKMEVDPALARAGEARPAVTAIFSSVARRGPWVVPARVRALTVFGNATIDFREARFSAGVTELQVKVIFGNLEIIVPPQLAVECDGEAVFATFEGHGGAAVADADRPLLRVVGRAVFASVEVVTRLPGESERQARRRRRGERALPAAEAATKTRRALPPHDGE